MPNLLKGKSSFGYENRCKHESYPNRLKLPVLTRFLRLFKNEVNHDSDKIGDRSSPSYCEL